ncbi:MAG: protoglobin domain-containing protein [Pseudanabaenaceae cyanobacterium SKYGB_i_bin29]|nr:protoglobin domain-containing protein [Pseudanabaenaceae cyanobacterium SKYG29]MDW8421674.1 protoglobin domain-containing protein [Pseudanabaenaceae cyanobacterium SKYGB_i_bin29]
MQPIEFLQVILRRIDLQEDDRKLLQAHADWAKTVAPEMADVFYSYLARDEEMNAILNAKEGRIHRLRDTFCTWFHEMFTGVDEWDKTYAESRWRIGVVHARIGIGPQHVVPAMAIVVTAVRQALRRDNKPESLADALSKICMIDLAFIEQAATSAILKETGWTEGLFKRLITAGASAM